MASSGPKMNEEDAEEFFDSLEAPLKETYKIPKKKSSSDLSTELQSPLSKSQFPSSPKIGYADQHKRRKIVPFYNNGNKGKKIGLDKLEKASSQSILGNAQPPKKELYGQKWIQEFYSGSLPHEVFDNCSETHCGLCDILITSDMSAQTHYVGKAHLKKIDCLLNKIYLRLGSPTKKIPRRISRSNILQKEILTGHFVNHCDMCNVSLSSPIVSLTHFQGQKHLKALKKLEEASKLNSSVKEDPSKIPINDYYCKVCKVDLKSSITLKEHLSGKPHMIKLKHYKADNSESNAFYCKICCLVAPNKTSFEAHCIGKKHLKKVLQSKDHSQCNLIK